MQTRQEWTLLMRGFLAVLLFVFLMPQVAGADVYVRDYARLSWFPNGEPDVKGYEIYRANSYFGPYLKVYNGIISGTSWEDHNLSDGMTYYYKLKAVDLCGNSSPFSPSSEAARVDLTAPTLSASPSSGTYYQAIKVSLAASETATIYYTTDGSTPTKSSPVYSGPISITKSTTLRSFAVDRAGNQSSIISNQYTIQLSGTDYDGDGFSNDLEEYMGTDPFDQSSQPAASSLTLSPLPGPIGIGNTAQLTVIGIFKPASGDAVEYDMTSIVTYHSDNSVVIAVDDSGKVTGRSEGASNVWAEQIVNGRKVATSDSIRATVDGSAPFVDLAETHPYNGQGTAEDLGPTPRIPADTGIVIRVVDSNVGDNIGIDEASIQLTVNRVQVPFKYHQVIPEDSHEIDIVYRNFEGFAYNQIVDVELSLSDIAGNKMSFRESFQVESQAEHQWALEHTPPQVLTNLGDGTYELAIAPVPDSINDEPLDGAKILFNDYEPVKPRGGPVDEIPSLDIATPVGIPLNLEPANVFEDPVTVILPLPGAKLRDTNDDGIPDAGLDDYDIYQYSAEPTVQWRNIKDVPGFAVKGSRVDHYDTVPPSIEVQVNHFSGIQIGKSDLGIDPKPDIKVNGKDDLVILPSGSSLSVTVSLDSGSLKGRMADWWILAETPNGWYSYLYYRRAWQKGIIPYAQMPLTNMQTEEIYVGPPPFGNGNYTLYFGVDDNIDNNLDGTFRDSVQAYLY